MKDTKQETPEEAPQEAALIAVLADIIERLCVDFGTRKILAED